MSRPAPLVPISALEHHIYCPRQCALIHVDGLWVESEHTARGSAGHARAHQGAHRVERGRKVLRGVPLWSERLGLTGRADIVEVYDDGSVVPVEYKIGGRHGQAGDVQLAAEALCLEEMTGRAVPIGYLWLSASRRRMRIPIDERLRTLTKRTIREARGWLQSRELPLAINDSRCRRCQLADLCQPRVSSDPASVRLYMEQIVQCGC